MIRNQVKKEQGNNMIYSVGADVLVGTLSIREVFSFLMKQNQKVMSSVLGNSVGEAVARRKGRNKEGSL